MLSAALITQCADPSLRPAIVEQFIANAGSQDPLAVTVRSGNRLLKVPKPTTSEEALTLIRNNLGRNAVRVGITQYPAGVGLFEVGQLKPDMVDPCENIRMGTALFAKVYRYIMKWYGNPTAEEVLPQVMDDAVIAWQTGYFEGVAVFQAEDPDHAGMATLKSVNPEKTEAGRDDPASKEDHSNPNNAGIRIDIFGISATR